MTGMANGTTNGTVNGATTNRATHRTMNGTVVNGAKKLTKPAEEELLEFDTIEDTIEAFSQYTHLPNSVIFIPPPLTARRPSNHQ
jgi:hypothetical protein